MLRRKLLLMLGSLVAMLVIVAFGAILLLNDVLDDLNRNSLTALDRSSIASELGTGLIRIEIELGALRRREQARLDGLLEATEQFRGLVHRLDGTALAGADDAPQQQLLLDMLPHFTGHVGDFAAARDAEQATAALDEAMEVSATMREIVVGLSRSMQTRTDRDAQGVTRKFRWLVLGLGLLFLLVINSSIFVLLRAAGMVIRPVEELVEASHRLAREEFETRVQLDQPDEFGELATAYNHLAEQLQLSEQRKLETLHQVARTLSHELNNALAIINLQLTMVARTSGGDLEQEQRLRQIHDSLHHMSEIVEALSRIRRIVLTDYVAGVKMLDLQRSVEDDPSRRESLAAPMAEPDRT